MIDYNRQDHSMEMACDNRGCMESSCFYGEFSECIAEAKDEGWVMHKDENDDWRHECPFCVEKGSDPREVFL